MKPKTFAPRKGPEAIKQDALIKFLRAREWFVKSTHGNMFQSGFPDLYCAHRKYGQRWIEVKNLSGYVFTAAQLEIFPQLAAVGVGVWVLIDATEEEYKKLWQPANWWQYLQVMK